MSPLPQVRRLLGDVILDVEDLNQDRKFPDGSARGGAAVAANDRHHVDGGSQTNLD